MEGVVATNSGKKAVVVGAGPVGAVAAIMLARQGWSVQVLEQYSAVALCKRNLWRQLDLRESCARNSRRWQTISDGFRYSTKHLFLTHGHPSMTSGPIC